MKTTQHFTKTLYIVLVSLMLCTCDNDDDNRTPLEQLPEATQTGRGVFGALVNGEAFIETGNFFNTFYQQIDGEFFFGIQGQFEGKNPRSITIGTLMRPISEGEILELIEREDGNAWGGVRFRPEVNQAMLAQTDSNNTGTLTITKLDFENNIVSGTFEITVIDPFTNEVVEVTDGRFDTLFTQ